MREKWDCLRRVDRERRGLVLARGTARKLDPKPGKSGKQVPKKQRKQTTKQEREGEGGKNDARASNKSGSGSKRVRKQVRGSEERKSRTKKQRR